MNTARVAAALGPAVVAELDALDLQVDVVRRAPHDPLGQAGQRSGYVVGTRQARPPEARRRQQPTDRLGLALNLGVGQDGLLIAYQNDRDVDLGEILEARDPTGAGHQQVVEGRARCIEAHRGVASHRGDRRKGADHRPAVLPQPPSGALYADPESAKHRGPFLLRGQCPRAIVACARTRLASTRLWNCQRERPPQNLTILPSCPERTIDRGEAPS